MKRLVLLVLAGLLAITGTASATGLPRVINGYGETLHPEGVAWDPTRQAFLVSSIVRGTISVVGPDGKARTLVNDPALTQPLGVHVDARRNRVLTAYSQGLGIFELSTGRTLHLAKFGKAPNDLAIDWFGNAYVTDPPGDTIYKVDVNGTVTPFVTDKRLAGAAYGMNGVVWHPAGFLLVVHYENGKLFKVTRNTVTEVAIAKPLVGGDGLAFQRDGSLVVVTNKLGVPGEDAVTVLRPRSLWASAVVTRHTQTPISAPTTAAVTPYGTYVVHGRLDWLFNEQKLSNEFFLSRI
ncbi:SMP-30/gluconolactonase/LRE family protein [Kibdelosporangium aridum]|uniref:Sugar lactone lactonase YvrE n=1 Tax=Kibdelosporangium aridum TaxID=2030 RepID=A0A1Y5XEK4_KIBAR|nr:SMP-30/gluconolactonase/LRE family protein [Kibdelosporangium aridum]SMC89281.1 Sugar lactone lactonase YvrE [Kibdelosporangium aridum]